MIHRFIILILLITVQDITLLMILITRILIIIRILLLPPFVMEDNIISIITVLPLLLHLTIMIDTLHMMHMSSLHLHRLLITIVMTNSEEEQPCQNLEVVKVVF
jgi:hypothetical protein